MSCYKPGLGPPPFAHTSQRCQSSGSLSDQGCLVLPAGECGGHNLPCLFSCPEHWTAFAIFAMFSFPPDRPTLFFPPAKGAKALVHYLIRGLGAASRTWCSSLWRSRSNNSSHPLPPCARPQCIDIFFHRR